MGLSRVCHYLCFLDLAVVGLQEFFKICCGGCWCGGRGCYSTRSGANNHPQWRLDAWISDLWPPFFNGTQRGWHAFLASLPLWPKRNPPSPRSRRLNYCPPAFFVNWDYKKESANNSLTSTVNSINFKFYFSYLGVMREIMRGLSGINGLSVFLGTVGK